MLNITHNQVNRIYYKYINRFLLAFAIILIIVMFLPWTQNISGQGQVTTLKPDQRPQTIQSQIPGRIEQWFVREGDFVKKGDTILRISEVKSEYFDDRLLERTNDQIIAKSSSVVAYDGKIKALNSQIEALRKEKVIKLNQARNKIRQAELKVKSDSIDYEAAKTNMSIAQRQFERTATLAEEGLKAVIDVEEKRLKLQESEAKLISQENKLLASRNELINAKVEVNATAPGMLATP